MTTNFPDGRITLIKGRCISIPGDDIDTDRIIPARFLKCVSFTALGDQVFADDRLELAGNHPFDLKENQGASILVVNDNFGCGSSREHAPQALMRWGIRCIVGQSFAEIFFGNCLALGIPCGVLSKPEISLLQELIGRNPQNTWEVNIEKKYIKDDLNKIDLEFDKGPHNMLISGRWDATSQLISNKNELEETMRSIPYLNQFKSN